MRFDIWYAAIIVAWVGLGIRAPAALSFVTAALLALALTAAAGVFAWVILRGMGRFLRDVWLYMPSD